MSILQVNPIEIKSYTKHCNNMSRNSILIGKRNDDNYYKSELTFKPIILKNDEIIIKAVLKMRCISVCNSYDYMNICINNDNVNLAVHCTGSYEWDVTSIVKCGSMHNLKLCAYTNDRISCCSIKIFEALDKNMKPVLELIVSDGSHNPVDIVEDYISTNQLSYSPWIDCICLNKYYYFFNNVGISDVEVYIEISPNKSWVYQDSGPFIIKANEVSYLVPMRESGFIRISYKNVLLGNANIIKVWFQGKD
ncbi:MAG: DUF6385 domain-containing protein [Eubacteriales bacterium]